MNLRPTDCPNDARWTQRQFARDSRSLAVHLLGSTLVRVLDSGQRLAGRIVETEAYLGELDRAAHSFAGRRSPRNEAMYARAGTAYVYFTYGMHWCFNVVCGRLNQPIAVLIRALEPLESLDLMRQHRTKPGAAPPADTDLCRGPARLCQALAIDRAENATDLTTSNALFIERATPTPIDRIRVSPRIGIDSAREWTNAPLRFFDSTSPFVSRHRNGTPVRDTFGKSASPQDPLTPPLNKSPRRSR